ncbi:uncharacterized protein [Dermacentor albipictus]|uniref:uncharacterized protein n=1 Tax=Dermacentor albipictus TaxID=60249 RepID=UPI0038FC2ECD
MNAVQKAKRRLSSYPDAFLRCSKQAAQYGKCVATADDLKVHDCTRQFQQLKICIQKHAAITASASIGLVGVFDGSPWCGRRMILKSSRGSGGGAIHYLTLPESEARAWHCSR